MKLASQARQYAEGRIVLNPEKSLLIYSFCKEFNCLPNEGGYYEQNPVLLDDFGLISSEIAKKERMKKPPRNKYGR